MNLLVEAYQLIALVVHDILRFHIFDFEIFVVSFNQSNICQWQSFLKEHHYCHFILFSSFFVIFCNFL